MCGTHHERSWIMYDASEPTHPVYHDCWTYISLIPIVRGAQCCSVLVDCAGLSRGGGVTLHTHTHTHTPYSKCVSSLLYGYAKYHEHFQRVHAWIQPCQVFVCACESDRTREKIEKVCECLYAMSSFSRILGIGAFRATTHTSFKILV